MLEFNIAPNTQIGRIIIPDKVYEFENAYMIEEEKYSRGGEFIENMVTDNIIEYCKRWFHLAGIKEFLEDIDEYYSSRSIGRYSNFAKAGFIESPIVPTISGVESPIEFTNAKESPIIFYNSKPTELDYETLVKRKESV